MRLVYYWYLLQDINFRPIDILHYQKSQTLISSELLRCMLTYLLIVRKHIILKHRSNLAWQDLLLVSGIQ
jgi:hypothetical protein